MHRDIKGDEMTLKKNDDIRLEINEIVDTDIKLTNLYREPLQYTFHGGHYLKYDISCKPTTGILRQNEIHY